VDTRHYDHYPGCGHHWSEVQPGKVPVTLLRAAHLKIAELGEAVGTPTDRAPYSQSPSPSWFGQRGAKSVPFLDIACLVVKSGMS
jgi:hypothetical protein